MLCKNKNFEDFIKAEPKNSRVMTSMEKIDDSVLDPKNK